MSSTMGISRRGLLRATAGAAAGAGLGLDPNLVLAQATVTPAAPASLAPAEAAVERHRDAILRISREVWELAELSIVEVNSFRVHLRELEAAGFTTVSTGTSGYPTAFVSEWRQGTGGPVVAYLPEYDALPGLGNAPEPRQVPAASGITDGHGCGHNMLGAGCTGAAIALKSMMEATGTPGTIRVFGCASEEAQGAKVYFVRDGLFDDVDVALAWHPAPFAGAGEIMTAANVAVKVRFTGRTAHAGNTPWDGRSALKGAELFGTGIQFMREHVLPTTRMHYIYESAGRSAEHRPRRGADLAHLARRKCGGGAARRRLGCRSGRGRGADDTDQSRLHDLLRDARHPAERADDRPPARAHDRAAPGMDRGGAGFRPRLPGRDGPARGGPRDLPSTTTRPEAPRPRIPPSRGSGARSPTSGSGAAPSRPAAPRPPRWPPHPSASAGGRPRRNGRSSASAARVELAGQLARRAAGQHHLGQELQPATSPSPVVA
jgi:hypothetical protein